ncbi:MAG: hypothetical protein E6K85_02690 [Thaumarchaeota archaeon]|nr:MAG: hypothetical protein E6K85_02690 [Nitrososphaerota archaeon]
MKSHINEIVKNLAAIPIMGMLQVLHRMFCNHKESFAYRRYDELYFVEFSNCSKCGKTLKRFQGFDEDMRG